MKSEVSNEELLDLYSLELASISYRSAGSGPPPKTYLVLKEEILRRMFVQEAK